MQTKPSGPCLAHLDPADRQQLLHGLTPGGDVDFRGVSFTRQLLDELLNALADHGPSRFGRARFDAARFVRIEFSGITFDGDCSFTGSIFTESTNFNNCVFAGDAGFGATPEFPRGARFEAPALFNDSRFNGDANFDRVEFLARASFEATNFKALAEFAEATFAGDPNFDYAIFNRVDFSDVTFSASDGSRLGPCTARVLDLSRARSHGPLTIQCGGLSTITVERLQCAGDVNLQLDGEVKVDASATRSARELTLVYRDTDLTLVDAAFDTPSTISGTHPSLGPRLLALDKVDATNLTLDGVDLDACRFKSCHNRDKLRIGGPLRFVRTPASRLWTNRYVLAEEHEWRAKYDRHPHDWFPSRCRAPSDPLPEHMGHRRKTWPAREGAAQVQSIYRDLRKGREDAKDEPGASDFYFGEMEMRRLAATPRSWERVLLTAYWAISGYGLRASRALATLVLVLALGTLGFATIGFGPSTQTAYLPVTSTQPVSYRQVSQTGPKPGWAAAVDQSVDSATALLRQNTPRPLTTPGRVIEILLRLLGPLLIGLAVLALRNRVKR